LEPFERLDIARSLLHPPQQAAARSPTDSVPLSPSSLPKSPTHTADDLTASSTAATPGRREHPRVNPPPWSKLYHKLQEHSDKPLDNLTVDTPHASLTSPPSELKPAPKDSGPPVTERLESSLEIPETPAVALEMMRCEEDDHGDNGNTPSHLC
jgi:hypothetical protein